MTNISKLWAGRVYGTNTGNVFIEFTEIEPVIKGVLRFNDNTFGMTVYEVTATYDGILKISGKASRVNEAIEIGDLTAEAELTPEGNLNGRWITTIGSGGTFTLFPHDGPKQKDEGTSVTIPEQMHTKYIELGSIRLFSKDIEQLFNQIKKDFSSGRLIVTYSSRGGAEVADYAEKFLRETNLRNLTYLKIIIQEPEAYGINRSVIVELRARGSNDIRVQGVQESWVIGKAETLAGFLKNYESTLITTYKKFGLNLNQLIFFTMLVAMPSVSSLSYRAIFALSVITLLSGLHWVHSKYVPNAFVSLSEKTPNWITRNWPPVISWLMGITASVIASLIFYWLMQKPV